MKTILKEFNIDNQTLRGLEVKSEVKSDKIIVCLPGFGRSAVSEKKFKCLSDLLKIESIPSLRIDYLGNGISDGEFKQTTVKNLVYQAKLILNTLKDEGYKNISVVAHSLSGCVVSNLIESGYLFEKIILIAPALNQKVLQRYWFTQKLMSPQKIEINILNYTQYFDESLFLNEMNRDGKMTKNEYINKDYFLENMNKKYSDILINQNTKNQIMMIQGLKDASVPFETQDFKPENLILIENGDHDLERPDLRSEWTQKAIKFLINK